MKILVLESSGLVASVAVVTEEKLIGEYTTNFKKTHSQTLLPMMDTLLKMIGIPVQEMDAIAVSGGPGSFTGLRIGSATAKGLGLALSIPIISVPTVDAIAPAVVERFQNQALIDVANSPDKTIACASTHSGTRIGSHNALAIPIPTTISTDILLARSTCLSVAFLFIALL